MNKNLLDLWQLLVFVVVLYFFIFGVLYVSNNHIECDFVVFNTFYDFNQSLRLDLNDVKAYVNSTGLFDNALLLSDDEFIGNCTFVFKTLS